MPWGVISRMGRRAAVAGPLRRLVPERSRVREAQTAGRLDQETPHEPVNLRAWVGCQDCYVAGRLVGRWVAARSATDVFGAGLAIGDEDDDEPTDPRCYRCGGSTWWVFEWTFDTLSCAALLPGECTPEEAARFGRLLDAIESAADGVGAVASWKAGLGGVGGPESSQQRASA
jgi:hypothetical protein